MPDPAPGRKEGASSPHLVEWLRTLPALITAVTALVTAVAALRKPPDDTPTRLTYQELSKVIDQLAEASQQNQQDLIALRNFLEGYIRAAEGRTPAFLATKRDQPDGELQRQPDRARPGIALPQRKVSDLPLAVPKAGGVITSPPPGGTAREETPAATAAGPGALITDHPARAPLQLPKLTVPRQLARPLPYRELLQKPEELFK